MNTLQSRLDVERAAILDEMGVRIERLHLVHCVQEWSGQHIHSLHICERYVGILIRGSYVSGVSRIALLRVVLLARVYSFHQVLLLIFYLEYSRQKHTGRE